MCIDLISSKTPGTKHSLGVSDTTPYDFFLGDSDCEEHSGFSKASAKLRKQK